MKNKLDPISARLLRNSHPHGSIALMYHSIATGSGTAHWRYALSMQRFRAQLDLLQGEGWGTYRLADLSARPLPPRSVVITFDDGYQDNFSAFNELEKRSMTASWFVVSRDIGRNSAWQDTGRPQLPMLNATQLREMQSAGMEIGSHSHTHRRLTECDDAALMAELTLSKSTLEDLLNTAVTSLAYPYGVHDARVVVAAKAAGYLTACSTRTGWAQYASDPLQIRRLSIYANDNLNSFARKLAFADNDVSWRRILRYASGQLATRLRS
ncbi:MAG TPA: polysaccharide deacetylase family protein [Sulfuriferula sp.]|nr:polysaccharide deacetylase family protein [Sulfuriferula sp.]